MRDTIQSKGKYTFLTVMITYLLPAIIFFDWLFNLERLNFQAGLYLKSLSTLIFIFFILIHKIKGFSFKNVLLYFLGLFIIYSLFSTNTLQNLYITARIAYWIFGSLVFYYFFMNNHFKEKRFRLMLLMVVAIASFFTIQLMSQSEEHQNASAYLLLWCLPFLLTFRKSKLIKIAIGISIIAIIITIKRGAMLALFISLVSYFYGMAYISGSNKSKLRVLAGSIVLLGFALFVVYLNWEFVALRLEDTTGSGRDNMYLGIISNYFNGDIFEIIFGRGINSVQRFTAVYIAGSINHIGIAAHSDWLQYMHDFGFWGLSFMIVMHAKFILLLKFHKKRKTELFPILLMSYVIFSLTTVYSFILNIPDAIILGILLAFFSSETNKIKNRTSQNFVTV